MDLHRLWQATLDAMRSRIGHTDVEIWLDRTSAIALDESAGVITVRVDNRYYSEWIRENYDDELRESLQAAAGRKLEAEFTWSDEAAPEEKGVVATPDEPAVQSRAIGINPRQTFERFVIGECNKFAHAAAWAVAEPRDDNNSVSYNPLFIYGSTGLGKTHLMHSIANRFLVRDAEARIFYVTAERFMNEMIESLQYKRMEDFRAKYRHRASLLLVDDVQFLSGKERTQEEFFHTFNALVDAGRQIVLTADVIPRDIAGLEPRLRTRFEGGLLADMQAPDTETLIAILQQKATNQRLRIPGDLADEIADVVAGNIRELEGILNRISAYHRFHEEPVTLDWARQRLPDIFDPPTTHVTTSRIIEAVAQFHNVRSADITGTKRTRNLTRPRHIAMFLAREHTGLSFPELGREFGGRDHSTIQHGCKRVQEEMTANPDLEYKVRLIEQNLKVRRPAV